MSRADHWSRHLLGAGLAVAVGCGQGDGADTSNDKGLGTVQVALQNVPSDIYCVQITSAGSIVRTDSFDVSPGASTTLTIKGIAPGSVKFTGAAFPTACQSLTPTSIPTWVADAVTKTIVSGTTTNVTIVMRPAGNAGVTVDFQGGGGTTGVPLAIWDSTNWDNA